MELEFAPGILLSCGAPLKQFKANENGSSWL